MLIVAVGLPEMMEAIIINMLNYKRVNLVLHCAQFFAVKIISVGTIHKKVYIYDLFTR